jgi:Mlc titration factor MtfA (ptsG expression regulator)
MPPRGRPIILGDLSVFGFFKRRRRARLRAAPFSPEWLEIIERNVRLYRHLPEADRKELQGLVQIFLAEKHFEGCGGLELTDEIKVTIAASACLLLLHRETDIYPRLITILVYPSAYVARTTKSIGGAMALESESINLGESWSSGVVILSWDDVLAGASDVRDGQNVVLHEFAHQLDREDGLVDGAPALELRSQYVTWARVLGAEYERLQRASRMGRSTVLDEYGATNPAEFFAVATESFFEKPHTLRRRHPELYEELKSFYRQDPARLVVSDRDRGEIASVPKNSDPPTDDSDTIREDSAPS